MRIALIAPALAVTDAFSNKADHLFRLSGGNIGNFAFVFALNQLLASNATELVGWDVNPDLVKQRYDLIVFACANQLGPHTDLGWLAGRLEAMDRPILAIGLGAQAHDTAQPVEIKPGTRRWLDVIADHAPSAAPNIGVRGRYTHAQLERLGHGDRSSIVGCPSNYINPDPALGQTIARRLNEQPIERIAVPAGLPLWPQLQAIESCLADLVESCSGIYVAQSEADMIRLARDEIDAIAPDVLEKMRAYIRPKLKMPEFLRWIRRYSTTFIDAASWIDAMRKFDFVVGPRFHGVMLAIQAGVPGGVIAHDSRTLELCQTMNIPVRSYKDTSGAFGIGDLKSMFPFDGAAYDRQRVKLAQALGDMLSHASVAPAWGNLNAIGTNQAAAA